MTGVALVAFGEGRPQHNQQLFQAAHGPGYGGDASLAKIIEEQRFSLDNADKFGHAVNQVLHSMHIHMFRSNQQYSRCCHTYQFNCFFLFLFHLKEDGVVWMEESSGGNNRIG